jgi:hypothetical protein
MIENKTKNIKDSRWMPEELWNRAKRFLPIPCIDLIFERNEAYLFGYRKISPYKNVWALIGGRMLFGENLRQSASRIASEYSLKVGQLYLVGVFPVAFSNRSDVAICLAVPNSIGDPHIDGKEFSKFSWATKTPTNTGGNYKLMINKWKALRSSSKQVLDSRKI